jgi:hypothetical protein
MGEGGRGNRTASAPPASGAAAHRLSTPILAPLGHPAAGSARFSTRRACLAFITDL